MPDESTSHGVEATGLSRRTVMKGAAWSVPVVMVASAAPAMAASRGPLTFTGRACKLPGNSSSIFKGYVFELVADNTVGPNPLDAVTVVRNVTVGGLAESIYKLVVKGPGSCTCSGCTTNPDHEFCTPEGQIGQRVLLYTGTQSNSQNTEICLEYKRHECDCSDVLGAEGWEPLCSGVRSTDPATPGGGSCDIPDVFPLPDGGVVLGPEPDEEVPL